MNFNWEKHGIDVSKVRGGKTTCPKCSAGRKHKKDPCLSVDLKEGLFNCHNCDFRGTAVDYIPKKEFVKPPARLEKMSAKTIDWFENERKISNNTLLRFGITEAKEWMPQYEREVTTICFNYLRDGELINIKFRGPKKSFKMAKDAELIFYNLDAIKDEKECVIVEGEIDCLSVHEAGIFNVVSVPNGASRGSQKLEYLDNCWKYFESKERIVLAVDGDEAGESLRAELIRRLGKDKCFTVEYPEGCKDLNEVLVKYGAVHVKTAINNAAELPIEGIKSMAEMYTTVTDWYLKGYPKGAAAGIDGFDHMLTFVPGQLTIVTGIPGHGKDEFLNFIMASLSKNQGWTWGICGFEETPEETVTKIAEKLTGKCFDVRTDKTKRISREEYESSVDLIDKYFFFINPDDIETDVESLIAKGEELVRKKGIKGFYLNPWNWIDHSRSGFLSETEYVSLTLSKIIKFAKRCQVHVFLLAHTTKMYKDKSGKYEVPTLYSISGSAHFFNKAHNGITVYRDYSTNVVDVYVQKVKQSWLGKTGFSTYNFDTLTRQYILQQTSEPVKKNELPAGNWKQLPPEPELFSNDDQPF